MDKQEDQSNSEDQVGQTEPEESEKYEMPADATPPEPMGGTPPQEQAPSKSESPVVSQQPIQQETPMTSGIETPKKPIGSYILIIFLVIILILGIMLFAAWRGWISNSLTEKIFGPATTPTPVITSTPTWEGSPTITSSPEVVSNINDEVRKEDLATLKDALEKYFADNSQYPESATIIKTSDSVSVLAQALVPSYLDSLSDDPLSPEYYYGYSSKDNQSFELSCVLEDKSDVSGTLVDSLNIYKLTNLSN